jgi:hypothetical protein
MHVTWQLVDGFFVIIDVNSSRILIVCVEACWRVRQVKMMCFAPKVRRNGKKDVEPSLKTRVFLLGSIMLYICILVEVVHT